jgi:transposase
MEVVYERCCGLDVHKRTVVACAITPGEPRGWRREVQTFGTLTADLLELADWLRARGITHVALESTGVYWQPVYNVLEGEVEILVVNARHLRAVPGRKTDVKDAEWLAELLQHGLVRGSFIPDRPQRELRELTRHRATLVQERVRVAQRLQKVLEGTNLTLGNVASDVLGASGRAMLEALLAGQSDPAALADLAHGRLREKRAELERALVGVVRPHHRFLLAELLAHWDYLDEAIGRVSAELENRLRPFEAEIERLDTIPGINQRVAEVLLAEVGPDVGRFPSARHLASWAGLCPGNHESAGKRLSGKTRRGSPWLRTALIEAAHGAARTKNTYLHALYHRLARRRGIKKALVAVAHTLLTIAYHLLRRQEVYRDLGPAHFDQLDRDAVQRRLVRRLELLGCHVTIEPPPVVA